MAATAYASLVSLLNTIDQIHTHPLVSTFFDINQIKSLSEKVDFLVDFVENNKEVEDLDVVRRIGDAAHEAEDTIEVYVADRILGRGESLSILPKLETIIEETESSDDFVEEYLDADSRAVEDLDLVCQIGDADHEAEDEYSDADSTEVEDLDLVRQIGDAAHEAEDEYSNADSTEVEDLDLVRQIGDAAYEAEDEYSDADNREVEDFDLVRLQVYVADRVPGRGEILSILPKMEMIIEEMESIKEEVIKVKGEIAKTPSFLSDMLPSSSAAPPPPAADEATTMLGFNDYRHKLWDELTGHDRHQKIISITGMGGIGKTTLARNLYEDSRVVQHFNVRAWVTVSQDASARRVFMQALSCLGGCSTDRDGVDDQQLSVQLHKALFNRRYLIVLDDTWSVEIWDKIKFFFPENNNGSRIIVTTRELKLVNYIGSSALPIEFLGEENSWKLFCEKTFPQQDFPPELEGVGKMIVKKCGGLPLAITVTGGLLRKSPRTQEYWEKVVKDRSSILNSAENNPLSILYLSYKYLPVCLKPCFLYLGLYPEDPYIKMDELIKLWVAEGFIKSCRGQSLEEVAQSNFFDLVNRNLILSTNLEYFSIHDMVRGLCLKVGEIENFYYVGRSIDGDRHFITDETTARRFYPQESHAYSTPSIFNPLIVPAGERAAPFKTRLLKVWHGKECNLYHAAPQEVNLRFISTYDDEIYEHDHLVPLVMFWCLQTLNLRLRGMFLQMNEIPEMPQLRHIKISRVCLPNPPPPLSDDDVCVLHNLQTLMTVYNLIFTEELCKRIPNIKELHISNEQSEGCHLENLCSFNKLESLHYTGPIPKYCAGDSLHIIKFPTTLKELTLYGCMMEWSFMAVIASLPHLQCLTIEKGDSFYHLQSLIIQGDAVATIEWICVDEQFVSLKDLRIAGQFVTKWIARSSNFPVLEKLFISNLRQLDEIPSGIGEIPTLIEISLSDCSESANISAVEILHEQQRFENFGLKVVIKHGSSEYAEKFREKIEELGLRCQNLDSSFSGCRVM